MQRPLTSRPFVLGLGVGAACVIAAGLLAGVGTAQRIDDSFVTSSADGRNAYLWEADGDTLRFVSAAHAEKGRGGDHDDHEHKDDSDDRKRDPSKGKPATDEKGRPADKGPRAK